jgi:hypothetical protein
MCIGKKKRSYYYTIGGGIFSKFFLEMTPLGVKTYGESEFDICETKKASMIQVLKRNCAKMRFFSDFSHVFTPREVISSDLEFSKKIFLKILNR